MEERHLGSSCLYSLGQSYKSPLDHPDFKYFCDIISEIQTNQYITGDGKICPLYYEGQLTNSLNRMKNVLGRMFGTNFEITVYDPRGEFFGVHIYPGEDGLSSISDSILERNAIDFKSMRDLWLNISDWHLDLDSNIFFNHWISLNPSEIASMIIFNIERIIFNIEIVSHTNMRMVSLLDEQPILVTKLVRASICKMVFVIPLILACRHRSYPYKKVKFINGSVFEKYSELKTVYLGMMNKLVLASSQDVDNLISIDDDIIPAIKWFFTCVDDMRFSTRNLGEAVEKLLLVEKSPYVRTILSDILIEIGNYTRQQTVAKESAIESVRHQFDLNDKAILFRMEQYKRQAREKIDKQFNKIISEGFTDLIDGIGNMKRISQREIDVIHIQAQKIQNAEDKLYVLDNLHNRLEIVNISLAMLESKDPNQVRKVKVSKQTLLDQKKQLESIREMILKKNVQEPTGYLLINYPQGYQG